jgi:hypothetical protein
MLDEPHRLLFGEQQRTVDDCAVAAGQQVVLPNDYIPVREVATEHHHPVGNVGAPRRWNHDAGSSVRDLEAMPSRCRRTGERGPGPADNSASHSRDSSESGTAGRASTRPRTTRFARLDAATDAIGREAAGSRLTASEATGLARQQLIEIHPSSVAIRRQTPWLLSTGAGSRLIACFGEKVDSAQPFHRNKRSCSGWSAAGGDQGVEQARVVARLGMPEHAESEATVGILDGLGAVVVGPPGHGE